MLRDRLIDRQSTSGLSPPTLRAEGRLREKGVTIHAKCYLRLDLSDLAVFTIGWFLRSPVNSTGAAKTMEMSVKTIFYMNQGGGGNWGAIRYSDFDLILLAESDQEKDGFDMIWVDGKPPMSIQAKAGKRLISKVEDLDYSERTVRPMATATTTDGIRIVFVHLKSGNEKAATQALSSAIDSLSSKPGFDPGQPTIWIGDFNRAKDDELIGRLGARTLHRGGGHSQWDLDRVYVSGEWPAGEPRIGQPSKAGHDHGHEAIAVQYVRQGYK